MTCFTFYVTQGVQIFMYYVLAAMSPLFRRDFLKKTADPVTQ